MDRIGVVGLGRMGSAMAARFAAEGVPVAGWTRSGRKVAGVAPAPDLATLVAGADVVVLSLFDDAAVADMLEALLALDMSGKLVIETSTVVPDLVTSRAARFDQGGAALVDAPISGGPDLVSAGGCGIFIGGEAGPAARATAALAPLSQRIFHVGPLGTGMVMKCLNNSMLQTYFAGLSEQLAIARRAGLPLETALTILCGGPAGVPMVRDRMDRILGRDDSAGFTVRGAHKDNLVFQAVAAEYGVDPATLRLAEAQFRQAMEDGLAEADPAAMLARAYHDA